MKRNQAFIPCIALLALLCSATLRADQPSAAEVRLRDMLKSTMLQLQTAQNDLAAAQATAAEDDQKIKDLTAQNDALRQQAISDKQASDKTIADLTKKSDDQAREIAAYKDAVAKWKAGYALAATAAKTREAERVKLNSANIVLQRRVDDLETKNSNLFQLGNEILTKYEKFGLGEAIAAKEPFVGLTRTKLETQVQGYQDKLLDQKSMPQADATPAPANSGPAQGANANQQGTQTTASRSADAPSKVSVQSSKQ
jgi:chromosome segregation ATPase